MKICRRCVLPETFPNIQFENGTCNFCRNEPPPAKIDSEMEKYRAKFEGLLDQRKGDADGYDCLICYSGGKEDRKSVV